MLMLTSSAYWTRLALLPITLIETQSATIFLHMVTNFYWSSEICTSFDVTAEPIYSQLPSTMSFNS